MGWSRDAAWAATVRALEKLYGAEYVEPDVDASEIRCVYPGGVMLFRVEFVEAQPYRSGDVKESDG